MRREELFEGIGELDEELLLRSEEKSGRQNRKYKGIFAKCAKLAAGFAVVVGAGAALATLIRDTGSVEEKFPSIDWYTTDGADVDGDFATGTKPAENYVVISASGDVDYGTSASRSAGEIPEVTGVEETHETTGGAGGQGTASEYVEVEKLLVSDKNAMTEKGLEIRSVKVDRYLALYHRVEAADAETLKSAAGEKLDLAENWYRLSGHGDMQYLIFENDNAVDENGNTGDGNSGNEAKYSLWEYDHFQDEGYPYRDVLQLIYGIDSMQDLVEIIVSPATMDGTDAGKAIQKEIGTISVSGEKDLEVFYKVLEGLVCYGDGHWEIIGLNGDDTPSSMQRQVRAGRYLTLVTAQGMKIDTLKYTGISGVFYEYGGIAYTPLTEAQKTAVEEILHITPYEGADKRTGAAGGTDDL